MLTQPNVLEPSKSELELAEMGASAPTGHNYM